MSESETVFRRVENLLQSADVSFDVLRHEAVYTSEEAAAVRGTVLGSGAKALICKGDKRFVMFVMPADLRLASKAVRKSQGWRKLRFANREEVLELTGLQPGSIPPFGSLFGLPTLCDRRMADYPTIKLSDCPPPTLFPPRRVLRSPVWPGLGGDTSSRRR